MHRQPDGGLLDECRGWRAADNGNDAGCLYKYNCRHDGHDND
jgi:hypothetical protein